jgi:hypothetical protein
VSGAATLGAFVLGLALFTICARRIEPRISGVFLILAAVGLFMFGPNPFLFGMFLATGWAVLTHGVENIFPVR